MAVARPCWALPSPRRPGSVSTTTRATGCSRRWASPTYEWVKLPFAEGSPPAAASGLRLRARDSAKLGQIMLSDGAWQQKQVLPKGWAAELIKPRLNGEGLYFYGYQWWLGRSFRNAAELTWAAGVGYGGQRLYVVPALDLVVMVNAGLYSSPLQGAIPLGIFTRVVLPALKD